MIMTSKNFGYPIKHKRKIPFDPTIIVSNEIANWNIEIFRLDSELNRYILSEKDYFELIIEAYSSNIHISTKLEGNPLSRSDVKRFTKGVFEEGANEKELDFARQEIMSHLFTYLLSSYTESWTTGHVKEIHNLLLQGADDARPGEFRDFISSIESTSGQELFIPAPPKHIEEELDSLIHWLNYSGPGIYPVIAGAIFFHEFESIHPFVDGNGRTGRSLFHLYLEHHNLPNSQLCLIERNIVDDTEGYYELLAKTDHAGDYQELIRHFSKAVLTSYQDAVEKYREKDLLSSGLDETSRRILVMARQYKNWFNLEFAKQWCRQISDYVLRTRLTELVDLGALEKKGATKSKRYRFADPLDKIIDKLRQR